jgi:hypothetical protein
MRGHLRGVLIQSRLGSRRWCTSASSSPATQVLEVEDKRELCRKPPRLWGFFWKDENITTFARFDDSNML